MIKWTVNADALIDKITKEQENLRHKMRDSKYTQKELHDMAIMHDTYQNVFNFVLALEELEFVDEANK